MGDTATQGLCQTVVRLLEWLIRLGSPPHLLSSYSDHPTCDHLLWEHCDYSLEIPGPRQRQYLYFLELLRFQHCRFSSINFKKITPLLCTAWFKHKLKFIPATPYFVVNDCALSSHSAHF